MNIGLGNGLSPNRWQTVIWTNADLRSVKPYSITRLHVIFILISSLNRQRRRSNRASLAVRLTFNQTPVSSPAGSGHSGTPATSMGSPVKEEEEAMETSSSSSENGLPVVGFCRDLISLSLDRFKGTNVTCIFLSQAFHTFEQKLTHWG